MLLDGFGCDPQLYAIWTSLLDFRALGSNEGQLAMLDLIGRQAVDAAQASVSQVLCHRIHQLGWAVCGGGIVADRFGQFRLVTVVSVSCRLVLAGDGWTLSPPRFPRVWIFSHLSRSMLWALVKGCRASRWLIRRLFVR